MGSERFLWSPQLVPVYHRRGEKLLAVVILLVILISSYFSDTSQMVFDRPTQGVFRARVVPKYSIFKMPNDFVIFLERP